MAVSPCRTICAVAVAAALSWAGTAGVWAADFQTAVVVSKKIRPYIQVMEGVLQQVAQQGQAVDPDLYFLDPENSRVRDQVIQRLVDGNYDLICAVGQEAAGLVWEPGVPGKKMVAAVLDLESVPGLPTDACGISLRIPVPLQVAAIAGTFPLVDRIGLLFDPENNAWFFDAARKASLDLDLEIIPMPVTGRARIAPVLKDHFGRVDLIWMIPDATIISEKIIHYVIKQGLYQNIGVIGYNPFFTRSGALFSFEFDYRALGRQAGEKMVTLMTTSVCLEEPPVFSLIINEKVAEKLQVRWVK
jgi:putative tryptophan/tyrosine transport system substrate-binding protein